MISKKQIDSLAVAALSVAYLFVPLHQRGIDLAKTKNAAATDIRCPWGGDTRDE